ncbi:MULTISPECIES: DUF302 domain-containing protein [Mycolicibacterium]|uniref:Uncharacterized conserved protein n=1 Tax=Mycolicibacterium senegalense TaxID=1796 RepID=A0A378T2G4_9MYCO|nr:MULTISPECIES: DUF302 domain-containing protein [Mycolicibacterium]MCV7338615.1 DUF302 domain-containing protein [Mycolicibacterium senegalense]MDR7289682.1 uncharacterized protein (DUF302 family) [Mycolicibacterium senegalense]QZA26496.1 DUF302 domain-containing protein [Mycolicibacterium senegalense]CDP82934.1 hypothetical protein BN975_00735 [Mycolicibacterium farcinogenes]STZ54959.1 Uncharacterized conserved protein [Mycolicibacterium senegalense]
MDIALVATTRGPFDEAVARTREALAEQGFGVLTEIDIKATLNAKLGGGAGDEVGDYLILGACNPQFAQQALTAFPQIGVLLPCNVVLRSGRGNDAVVVVEAMNPNLMAEVTDEPVLTDIATEVGRRLQAALDRLR